MPKAHAKSYAGFAPRQLLFFCSVLSGACALATGALAADANAPVSAPESNSNGLQEIVVTATRHEESLSKVPISVTALTQDAMDERGIKDFQDIARFTPGVNIDNSGTNAISIRGISSSAGAGTTGIYIDDTPIQMRSLGFNPDDTLPKTFDLERVEVLRGPQGTLFGAGAEGGAVRYIMTKASTTESETYVRSEVSYTEHGQPSGEFGIAHGMPIVEGVFGVRASVWYRYDGGWINRVNDTTGDPLLASSSDVSAVTLLRLHAYAMSGRTMPAYPVPPPPVMTNVERVASSTAGAGNLLEWRGSPGAAWYIVQRAVQSASGPWATAAKVNAGTLELPYLDSRGGTGPGLWYRVTAVNAGGVQGAASAPFHVIDKTLDDNLDSFSVSESHSPGVGIDRSNAWQFGGDPSRAAFPPQREATATWGVHGDVDTVETLAYYGSINDMHFTFQVSNNNRTWQGVPTSNVQAIQIGGSELGDRIAFLYTLDNVQRVLPGANYVRIVRHAGGGQAAEIGEVRITYR